MIKSNNAKSSVITLVRIFSSILIIEKEKNNKKPTNYGKIKEGSIDCVRVCICMYIIRPN